MTFLFYAKAKAGKFLANLLSAFATSKEQRHRWRYRLDPLNPERCIAYLAKHYTSAEPVAAVQAVQSGNAGQNVITGKKNIFADGKRPVWVCWLQGRSQAPQIVEQCLRSIERHLRDDDQLIIVTADNYADYVQLPPTIVDKWQRGIITNTHFSDLFRIYALARHGGLWIDATCLLTAPVPSDIREAPLFMFHSHGEFSYTLIQSCFISARPGGYAMRKWCAAMADYWEHENSLINYFTLHLMFRALLSADAEFAREFASVPVVSDKPMHVLLYAMSAGKEYSDELMGEACRSTFVQKLTYKFPSSMLSDPSSVVYNLIHKETPQNRQSS